MILTQYPVEIDDNFENLQDFQKWLDENFHNLEVPLGKDSVKSLIKLSPYTNRFVSKWVQTGYDSQGMRLINIESESLLIAKKKEEA